MALELVKKRVVFSETKEQFLEDVKRGLSEDDFVFIRPDGKPINPNAITLAFRRIIRKAGLKHIRVHDLRHTHATLMLKAGVHPKIVSERLGQLDVNGLFSRDEATREGFYYKSL